MRIFFIFLMKILNDIITKESTNGQWWNTINWASLRRTIKIFQDRIAFASKMGNLKETDRLMRLLVKSESAKILAVYHITQRNKGRFTAGVDGKTYLTPEERIDLSSIDFNYLKYKFDPLMIRHIPKKKQESNKSKKKLKETEDHNDVPSLTRPIGIMAIRDRVMSKILSFALMAKWNCLLETNVNGFREGYSRYDAINMIRNELRYGKKVILKADIKDFFEQVKHDIILRNMGIFKGIIRQFLKIKIIQGNRFIKKEKGIIQGSPLSPILANIALHGMQTKIEQKNFQIEYNNKNRITLIRYADDFIVLAPSKTILEKEVIPELTRFLKKRGLRLNQKKTKIFTRKEGFTFLGFQIKQKEIISIKESI